MARVREMAGGDLGTRVKFSQPSPSNCSQQNIRTGVTVLGDGGKVGARNLVSQQTVAKRPHENTLKFVSGVGPEEACSSKKTKHTTSKVSIPVQRLISVTDVDGNNVSIDCNSPLTIVFPTNSSVTSSVEMVNELSEVCDSFKIKSQRMEEATLDSLKQIFWNLLNSPDVPHEIEFVCVNAWEKQNPIWKAHFIICNVLCATFVAGSKKVAKDAVVSAVVRYWKDHNVIAMQEVAPVDHCDLGYTHRLMYMNEFPSADLDNVGEDCKVSRMQSIMASLPHAYATHEFNCIITAAPKMPRFVLVESAGEAGKFENPVEKLVKSSSMSKVPVEFIMDQHEVIKKKTGVLCTVVICSDPIARGVAPGQKDAKYLAAHNAVQALKMTNVTLQKSASSDGKAISRDELIDGPGKEEALPDTNVGHKLLKMMGWTGEGGLGKKGEGIENPVKATGSGFNTKKGLGFDLVQLKDPNTRRLDEGKVWQYLQDYARSEREEELVFAADLSHDERKKLHHMSAKLGLKSHSRGRGDTRYLTIGHKWDVNKLVQAVVEKGGSMGNYQLVGPSSL